MRQCQLLYVPRPTFYYERQAAGDDDRALMRLIDECPLKHPYYGSRRIRDSLEDHDHRVNRTRVQRLMRQTGLAVLYPKRNSSRRNQAQRVYPYRLRGLRIERSSQIRAADMTFIPMAKGFVYLVANIDWYSRKVLAWRPSNALDTDFFIEALQEALLNCGQPAIFNTDQGSQFPGTPSPRCCVSTTSRSAWTVKTVDRQCVRRAVVAQPEV